MNKTKKFRGTNLEKSVLLHILSRIDDVINVAGHRLDTGRIEEAINHH
jgi:propionyl-CoA synthetase